ncbi:hypothetical protein [Gemelliphila palaticanis]|uniref:Lipoprotein n=1 Tax=Gemelliphila palaticanis TaxID=81950 RepID=A0ABX2T0G3_9BACL|nr:hypothetical protein [Gemella palaticanis]MBF0716207.1 hypothetical protein [Gemella palaticanis]NYS48137.1 hypothetical protein [Gemella palaticanis]
MKKFLSVLMVGTVLLSGCTVEKDSAKNKPVTNVDKSTKETKENETKKESKEIKKLEHDKELARSFVNDPIAFGVNNIDINTRGAGLDVPPGISTIPLYSKDKIEILEGHINIVPLNEFVDVYNTYNREVYNEEDVVASIKEIVENNNRLTYIELDEKRSDKSLEDIKSLLSKQDTLVFFKGDKQIAYNIIYGLGGAGLPIAGPYEDWEYKGDLVEIPMVGSMDGKFLHTVVLKLNDKEYTGGKNKSLYYYYDVVKK